MTIKKVSALFIIQRYSGMQPKTSSMPVETVLENKELDNKVDKVQDKKAGFVLLACDYVEDCTKIFCINCS